MQLIKKDNNITRYYSVKYDKEKLLEILEKLKEYSYTDYVKVAIFNNSHRPIIEKIKRDFQRKAQLYKNAKMYDDTIEVSKDGIVTYLYSYEKLPDLYNYIDMIVNNRKLFGSSEFSLYTSSSHETIVESDQCLIDNLLKYINSPELINHDEKGFASLYKEEDYNYKGLRKLYSETLSCFKFTLEEEKRRIRNASPIDGREFQLANQSTVFNKF